MISIDDKKLCCGCEACAQICSMQCIEFKEDEEGFIYPNVDKDKCIDCGLCESVCPVIHQDGSNAPLDTFAAKNKDIKEREESSSGGIFMLLAKRTIDHGGIVFGAKFNENWELIHAYTDNYEGIKDFMGSKYLQSRIGGCYAEAKMFLDAGREVLFSGTPCQIAGLNKYLGKKYANLLTVEVICHGVPSPGMFRWYVLEEIENVAREGEKKAVSSSPILSIPKRGALGALDGLMIKGISFRDKRKGWKKFSFALSLAKATADGKSNSVSLSYTLDKCHFIRGFLKNLYLRPSCYHCPSKNMKSGSDITLGDFWGISRILPEFDDDKGVSAVMVNTERGGSIFNALDVERHRVSYDYILKYNPVIKVSVKMPKNRDVMFQGEGGFSDRVKSLAKPTLLGRVKNIVKIIIRRK